MKYKLLAFLLLISASATVFSAPYLMRTENDCGPAAIHAVTDIPYEKVCEAMGWKPSQPDITDNPAAHLETLKKLKVQYANRSINDVLNGKCRSGKTVILLHSKDNKSTILPETWTIQHWVVLNRVESGFVIVTWGDGTNRLFTTQEFIQAVTRGGPTNTIYEVGAGQSRPKKWFGIVAAAIALFFGKF